jgi:hypothetical protein
MINRQEFDQKTLTSAQREAHKLFAEPKAVEAVSEYEATQKAIYANRDRLKAERLAREAAPSVFAPAPA